MVVEVLFHLLVVELLVLPEDFLVRLGKKYLVEQVSQAVVVVVVLEITFTAASWAMPVS